MRSMKDHQWRIGGHPKLGTSMTEYADCCLKPLYNVIWMLPCKLVGYHHAPDTMTYQEISIKVQKGGYALFQGSPSSHRILQHKSLIILSLIKICNYNCLIVQKYTLSFDKLLFSSVMFVCPIVHFLIFNLFYISEFFDADNNMEALGQLFTVHFGYWGGVMLYLT